MNAKEQLNKIKKENSFHLGFTSNRGVVKHSMPVEDINWLIEQVELFQQERDKQSLIKANIDKQQKIDSLQDELETLSSALHDARHEIRILKNKIERQKQTLEFYADEENYKFKDVAGNPSLEIGNDSGKRARKELIGG